MQAVLPRCDVVQGVVPGPERSNAPPTTRPQLRPTGGQAVSTGRIKGSEGGGDPGMHWKGGRLAPPLLQGAPSTPSHCPPDAKRQPPRHL